jgi:hypothetical protein
MARTPPLPHALWRTASPELEAAILLLVRHFEQQIAELKQQVQGRKACLDQNSTHRSKPPSSDPVDVKRQLPVPPSKSAPAPLAPARGHSSRCGHLTGSWGAQLPEG